MLCCAALRCPVQATASRAATTAAAPRGPHSCSTRPGTSCWTGVCTVCKAAAGGGGVFLGKCVAAVSRGPVSGWVGWGTCRGAWEIPPSKNLLLRCMGECTRLCSQTRGIWAFCVVPNMPMAAVLLPCSPAAAPSRLCTLPWPGSTRSGGTTSPLVLQVRSSCITCACLRAQRQEACAHVTCQARPNSRLGLLRT